MKAIRKISTSSVTISQRRMALNGGGVFTAKQQDQLKAIFLTGVCDYSKPGNDW